MTDEAELIPFGSRVALQNGNEEVVFLIVKGGYVVENDWVFHSSDKPFTTAQFKVLGS